MGDEENRDKTAPEALKQWRTAERAVAVARRGRLAAQAAVEAAQEAADAAIADRGSVEDCAGGGGAGRDVRRQDGKSRRKLTVESTLVDVADTETETAFAEIDEAEAHGRYRDAAARAAKRGNRPEEGRPVRHRVDATLRRPVCVPYWPSASP